MKTLKNILILLIGACIGMVVCGVMVHNIMTEELMKYENIGYVRRYEDFEAYLNDMNYEVWDETTDRPGNHLYDVMEYNGLEYRREIMKDKNGDWWIRSIY